MFLLRLDEIFNFFYFAVKLWRDIRGAFTIAELYRNVTFALVSANIFMLHHVVRFQLCRIKRLMHCGEKL